MSYNHKISDLIYEIPNLLPKDACKDLIDHYEEFSHLAWSETSLKYKTGQKSTDNFRCLNLSQFRFENKKIKEKWDLIMFYINIMVTNYVIYIRKDICPTFRSNNIGKTDNIRIIKYKEGEFIGDHSDLDLTIRGSCTINLNEDYEGGEFRFFDGKIKKNLKTGHGLIFPGEPIWIHGTEPIKKGTRYTINCFLKP
tara:strand:- start:2041 stop:2628 length:588 start_codon:yes stop_codon:yes gene_type:complete